MGRTGVFIAVDKILDDLDTEKKETIDIFGFVKDMRTRRVNMVQTAVRVWKTIGNFGFFCYKTLLALDFLTGTVYVHS